jgi:copper chaperone CopZ
MDRITVRIEGMMCQMCESHVNDAVRNAFPVKKVTSSHQKGEMEILTQTPIDGERLRAVIGQLGYTVGEIRTEPYEKRSFSLFRKRKAPPHS